LPCIATAATRQTLAEPIGSALGSHEHEQRTSFI
jgi:hypothetical protein